jgi:hypothetical protein
VVKPSLASSERPKSPTAPRFLLSPLDADVDYDAFMTGVRKVKVKK